MVDTEEQIITQLEQEFVPLDPALIRAIVYDYDLSRADDLKTVRESLDTLRASSVAEDDGFFDPSGTTSAEFASPGKEQSGLTHSASSETESISAGTGFSGLSLGSAGGSNSANSENQALGDYASLNDNEKLSMLTELFPTLRPGDIAFTLKKCDHDLSKALDVLLNHVFFEESYEERNGEIIPNRGIDAFAEDNNVRRGRPKKNKAKKFQNLDDYARSSSLPVQTPANKWDSANRDVSFISSRVKMQASTVASLYHKHGASQAKTIIALVEDDLKIAQRDQHNEDTQVYSHAVDLVQDFPTLTFEYCAALIRLTAPSTANAHELAKALTQSSESPGLTPLIPQYAPVRLTETSPSTRTTSPLSPTSAGDSKTLLSARASAFDSASKYYRKGKSDRLMGGAAAYYASIGREYSAAIQTATAAESDAFVSSQSSATQLDLHGVTVKEATRIACERVPMWWDGLGESRVRGGGRNIGPGYRIITGVGRHSEHGVAKLGPAVMKALLRDGWRIEVGSGELTVTGKMKR